MVRIDSTHLREQVLAEVSKGVAITTSKCSCKTRGSEMVLQVVPHLVCEKICCILNDHFVELPLQRFPMTTIPGAESIWTQLELSRSMGSVGTKQDFHGSLIMGMRISSLISNRVCSKVC